MKKRPRGLFFYFQCSASDLLGLRHGLRQVNQFIGVAPLIIVPAYYFNEIVIQRNAGLGIKNGSAGITNEIL